MATFFGQPFHGRCQSLMVSPRGRTISMLMQARAIVVAFHCIVDLVYMLHVIACSFST